MPSLSMTQARRSLPLIVEAVRRKPSTVIAVTQRGKRVLTVVAAELYDAMAETLEILSDPKAVKKVRRARKEVASGRGISWTTAKKRLGISG